MLKIVTITILLFSSQLVFSQYQKQVVSQVYNKLIGAIGNNTVPTPLLTFSNSSNSVAAYTASENKISFELKAYDICRSFGKDSLDAIAFILAHELGHVYLRHGWLAEFKSAYASEDFGKQMKKNKRVTDTLIIYETHADEFACFYSGVAGYKSLKIADQLIDSLYVGYNLPDELKKYPSRENRKLIVTHSREDIEKYIDLFHYSKYQYLFHNFKVAHFGFEYIAKKFPSRELFNNIGVCEANMALEMYPPDSIRMQLPFELDPDSRLMDITEAGSNGEDNPSLSHWDIEKRRRTHFLLQSARKNFARAFSLDPNYFNAQLNGTVINILLLEDIEVQIGLIRMADLAVDDYEKALIPYVKAFQAYMKQDYELQTTLIAESASMGSPLAQLEYEKNLMFLAYQERQERIENGEGIEFGEEATEAEEDADFAEMIEEMMAESEEGAEGAGKERLPEVDGINLFQIANNHDSVDAFVLKQRILSIEFYVSKTQNSKIYVGMPTKASPFSSSVIQVVNLPNEEIFSVKEEQEFLDLYGDPERQEFTHSYNYSVYYDNIILVYKDGIAVKYILRYGE